MTTDEAFEALAHLGVPRRDARLRMVCVREFVGEAGPGAPGVEWTRWELDASRPGRPSIHERAERLDQVLATAEVLLGGGAK